MQKTATKPKSRPQALSMVITRGKERLKIWERAEGMWKNRKPDPIKELNKIRKELDRKLP